MVYFPFSRLVTVSAVPSITIGGDLCRNQNRLKLGRNPSIELSAVDRGRYRWQDKMSIGLGRDELRV